MDVHYLFLVSQAPEAWVASATIYLIGIDLQLEGLEQKEDKIGLSRFSDYISDDLPMPYPDSIAGVDHTSPIPSRDTSYRHLP